MKKLILSILLVMFILKSCKNEVQVVQGDGNQKSETLIKMNNYVAKRNQELVAKFVKRTGLAMTETGSGLWYGVYSNGDGKKVKSGDIVCISYNLRLLDGTRIDSVSSSQPKEFQAGKGGVEAGLEEGILFLHEGDSARFIIPPHLAHGNFGDQEKIPPGAFLFYDLYLLRIKP